MAQPKVNQTLSESAECVGRPFCSYMNLKLFCLADTATGHLTCNKRLEIRNTVLVERIHNNLTLIVKLVLNAKT